MTLPRRHAISRSKLFLDLAESCDSDQLDLHEAYLEASIVFCRTAIHRLQHRYKKFTDWKPWFDSLLNNPSIVFIRGERNFILKEAPPTVGQVIHLGSNRPKAAKYYYFYDNKNVPAIDTVRNHVREVERIVLQGESKFGSGTEIKP